MRNQTNLKVLVVLAISVAFPGCGANAADGPSKTTPTAINSYEDCVAAGYPVAKSYPPKCFVPGGKVFTLDLSKKHGGRICKDLCGDDICQQMVCEAEGCPCAETPSNCPKDCAATEE